MLAVMYVKNCRSVCTAKRKRKFSPVVVPWIVDQFDGNIGVNRCITVDQLLKQIVTAPFPEFNGNVFSIVNWLRRIILYRIAKRFCRHVYRCALHSLFPVRAAASRKTCHHHRRSQAGCYPAFLHFKLLLVLFAWSPLQSLFSENGNRCNWFR